jgi:GT2 family glycosyltransferase
MAPQNKESIKMNIAAVVITYNDGYKLDEWIQHYNVYRHEIYKYIIVDNASEPEYFKLVEKHFPQCIILRNDWNEGCTGAYNRGIGEALKDPLVDSIMLIGNDIKLEKGGSTNLYKFLYSDDDYGMVSPLLLAKNSTSVEDYGCEISERLLMEAYSVGLDQSQIKETSRIVSAVTGGMNMSKRSFYETVGLQDENLFMYSDEVDMAIRAKKAGFKLAVTSDALAWHQHINPDNAGQRQWFSIFLINRNKIYLAYKHYGWAKAMYVFTQQSVRLPYLFLLYLRQARPKALLYYILGSIFGILGIKKNYRLIIENRL